METANAKLDELITMMKAFKEKLDDCTEKVTSMHTESAHVKKGAASKGSQATNMDNITVSGYILKTNDKGETKAQATTCKTLFKAIATTQNPQIYDAFIKVLTDAEPGSYKTAFNNELKKAFKTFQDAKGVTEGVTAAQATFWVAFNQATSAQKAISALWCDKGDPTRKVRSKKDATDGISLFNQTALCDKVKAELDKITGSETQKTEKVMSEDYE